MADEDPNKVVAISAPNKNNGRGILRQVANKSLTENKLLTHFYTFSPLKFGEQREKQERNDQAEAENKDFKEQRKENRGEQGEKFTRKQRKQRKESSLTYYLQRKNTFKHKYIILIVLKQLCLSITINELSYIIKWKERMKERRIVFLCQSL